MRAIRALCAGSILIVIAAAAHWKHEALVHGWKQLRSVDRMTSSASMAGRTVSCWVRSYDDDPFGDEFVRIQSGHNSVIVEPDKAFSLQLPNSAEAVAPTTELKFDSDQSVEQWDTAKEITQRIPIDQLDLDGDGFPEFVITSGSGHFQDPIMYYIVDASRMQITSLSDFGDNGSTEILFLDEPLSDPRFVVLVFDLSAIRGHPHAHISPPRVPLRYRDGVFVVDRSLMVRPTPDSNLLSALADSICLNWDRPPYPGLPFERSAPLMHSLLELVYSGHPDLADVLLDRAWPRDVDGKQQFRDRLFSDLKKSPYWPDIFALAPDYWQHVEAPK